MAIYKVLMILNWLKYLKIRVVISTFLANKAFKRLYLRFSPETLENKGLRIAKNRAIMILTSD